MGILEKHQKIVAGLKAPKNQYNPFGKYKYRNCEDILEAVKPLLEKYGCTLRLADEPVESGGRNYIKAEASLFDIENGESVSASAFAREADEKKGMDAAQVTGAASSYARKYALNGLFCIDDTKDPDAQTPPDAARAETPAEAPEDAARRLLKEYRMEDHASDILKAMGKPSFAEFGAADVSALESRLRATRRR